MPARRPPSTIRYSSRMGRSLEPALQDLADPRRVASLGREGRARHVRRHAVMRHGPPRVVRRCRLGEPDVTGVPGQLSALEGADDGVAVADLAPGRVDDVRPALHRADQGVVEHALGLGMQRER